MRLVEIPGGLRTVVDGIGVQRAPLAVGSACRVDDDNVGVQLRVAGPARAMPECRRHEPVGTEAPSAGMATPHPARLAFQVVQSRPNGGLVRANDCAADLGVAEHEQ